MLCFSYVLYGAVASVRGFWEIHKDIRKNTQAF